jgi:hypothetical protein
VTLSNHTAEKAAAAAARRRAEHDAAMEAYHKIVEEKNAHKQRIRDEISSSWRKGNVWAAFLGYMRLISAFFSLNPKEPVLREPDREETVWESGHQGECRVSDTFAAALDDEWTLILGYHNARGEIDQILVGPSGVFAMEIKYVNGTVYCDGDRWWRDKYDRYDDLVESDVPIQDKTGRGPSKQLNDAAHLLESFLSRRAGVEKVHRIVLFSHESSKIGHLHNVRVDRVETIRGLDPRQMLVPSSAKIDPALTGKIIKLISNDHDYHKTRPRVQKHRTACSPVMH